MDNKAPIWTKEFIGITIINLLIFLGFQMLLPTLPIYVESIGGTDSAIGWILGLSTVASLLIRPFSGIALDKFGRKGILLLGGGITILTTLAYMWFPIVGIILILRFLHGLGWGAVNTASSTAATDIISKTRFGEGIGYFSLSTNLAMGIAPGIGLSILNAYDITGLSMSSVGFGVMALLIALFIPYHSVEKQDVEKSKIAPYEKTSILPSLIMFFVTTSFGSITSFISLYAAEQDITNIGMFFLIYAVAMVLSRPIFGKIIDRLGYNAAIYPGLIFLVLGMVLLSGASALPVFIIAAFLYGIGFGAAQSSLQTMSVIHAPRDRFGAANATFFTGFDGGIGFGSVIAGIVVSILGYSRMYLVFSLCPVLAGILYFFSGRIKRR